jgi:hypothetical protein
VDIRFNKLQELKLNSWKEKAEAVNVKAKQPLSRGLKQSKVFKKQSQSSLRSVIMGMVIFSTVYSLGMCHHTHTNLKWSFTYFSCCILVLSLN